MAYLAFDDEESEVGSPLTKDKIDKIINNLNDHESRLNDSETTGGSVFIFNGDVHLANFDSSKPDILYHKVIQDFQLSDFRVQLFSKDSIATGLLKFDVQKSTDTNPANFNSVLSAELSFNFATDADYLEKVASINSSVSEFAAGEVLRVVVTGVPSGFKGKVLMNVGGE